MINHRRIGIGLAALLGAAAMFAPLAAHSTPSPLSKLTAPASLIQEARVTVYVGPRRHHRRWHCWWHRGRRVCGWRRW